MDLETGSVFAGHRIDGRLGKGGMGVVYRATDLQLDRQVALKLVAPELAADPAFAERFNRESRLAASLDHPNVIPIYHAGDEDGRLFVTMRLVEGTDLATVLRRDRRLAPDRAVAVLGQVAAALDAAHARGLVHRDVKPANILLQGDHVFLSDFGLSKQVGSAEDLTETGAVLGTVDYMAPEQVKGGVVDARSDVYALGCVLFQTLSGRVPFERSNGVAKLFAHVSEPAPRVTDVPGPLADVVQRAMEKDPGRRFQSAGELADSAAVAIGASIAPVTSRPPTAKVRPTRSRRRRGGWIAAAGVVVAAVVIGAVALSGAGGGDGGTAATSKDRAAISDLLRLAHRGFTVEFCRDGLTQAAREAYFDPRTGEQALIACENLAGGPANESPLVVHKLVIQGSRASANIDSGAGPVTFYLLKGHGRWRINDFTETVKGRYVRRLSSAIQPSFRNTKKLQAFTFGQLPLADADGVPARAVTFLQEMVAQLPRIAAPARFRDIHRRLEAAAQRMLAGAQAALAAQKAGNAKTFMRSEKQLFAGLRSLGSALGDLDRAQ